MRFAPWWKQTFPRITVQIVGDLICLCSVQNDNVQKWSQFKYYSNIQPTKVIRSFNQPWVRQHELWSDQHFPAHLRMLISQGWSLLASSKVWIIPASGQEKGPLHEHISEGEQRSKHSQDTQTVSGSLYIHVLQRLWEQLSQLWCAVLQLFPQIILLYESTVGRFQLSIHKINSKHTLYLSTSFCNLTVMLVGSFALNFSDQAVRRSSKR